MSYAAWTGPAVDLYPHCGDSGAVAALPSHGIRKQEAEQLRCLQQQPHGSIHTTGESEIRGIYEALPSTARPTLEEEKKRKEPKRKKLCLDLFSNKAGSRKADRKEFNGGGGVWDGGSPLLSFDHRLSYRGLGIGPAAVPS